MHYTTLGRTDLKVSRICLGTMTWGQQNTQEEAFAQMDRALKAGVNFFDTAELYPVPPRAETQGRTEQYIGNWIESRGSRDQIVLATKAVGPAPRTKYFRDGARLNRDHLERALERSLRNLKTDCVDLYQLHWPERGTNFFSTLGFEVKPDPEPDVIPIEETLEALDSLVKAGKTRHVGISNETAWGTMRYLRAAETSDLTRIASIQNPYSLLNRSFEVGLAEVAYREEVGLLAYSPLGFGKLTGKYIDGRMPEGSRLALFEEYTRYSTPSADEAVAAYVNLATAHGLSPAQMSLAFLLEQPWVTSVIIGATNMVQLEENLGAIDVQLSKEVRAGIQAIHKRYSNPCP